MFTIRHRKRHPCPPQDCWISTDQLLLLGLPSFPAYSASKFAIRGLIQVVGECIFLLLLDVAWVALISQRASPTKAHSEYIYSRTHVDQYEYMFNFVFCIFALYIQLCHLPIAYRVKIILDLPYRQYAPNSLSLIPIRSVLLFGVPDAFEVWQSSVCGCRYRSLLD